MRKLSILKISGLVFVVCAMVAAAPAQTLTTVHSFAGTDGAYPYATLVQANDGNFYGTTGFGGTSTTNCAAGCGTVFQINSAGTLTTVHSFTGTDGISPGALMQATDGNFYGTSNEGGASANCTNGCGTVFKITSTGAVTTLHSFTGTDGSNPPAVALAQGTDGNLYGTTGYGGTHNYGTVFKITLAGTLTTLHNFNGSDGLSPFGGVMQSIDGSLYGTTLGGGAVGDGTVFKITFAGTLTTLHSFDSTDGLNPWGGLIQVNGDLYGTTQFGGAYGDGTIFKITPWGAFTRLHSFAGTDGYQPLAGLVEGTDGNLYGTTSLGGTISTCADGCGTIFEITTAGRLTTLHNFAGTDGHYPGAAVLVQGSDGNLYGSTAMGGASSNGTVFRLNVGLQPFTNLYDFAGPDGEYPQSGLVQGPDGNLYGTARNGGEYSAGSIFNFNPASGVLTILYSFRDSTDGGFPEAGLALAIDGSFYGTTNWGGSGTSSCAIGCGTVFKITPEGVLTTLHSFEGTDGSDPSAPLVQASDGNLYGTTYLGGASNNCSGGCGTVFKITPTGTLTTLHSFTGPDGAFPNPGLMQANDGNLYGATAGGGKSSNCSGGCGTVFKITPAGTLTTLHSFAATGDGAGPNKLVQASDGNLYGSTSSTVFKITVAGRLTTLHSFTGPDGSGPSALVQATDGNFYGSTSEGGTSSSCNGLSGGCGTVFKITPAGTLTTLHSFAGMDGDQPEAPLVQATDGNFYGTTMIGGGPSCFYDYTGCGSIFRLSVGMGPFVSTLPTSGKVGAAVTILGNNLTGATSVRFNGTAATFTVVSSSEITTVVPADAPTGSVTVAAPGGTLKSNVVFRVTPQIKTFGPTSGPVGTVVTITGVSLEQTAAVYFAGASATFTVMSDSELTAIVPPGAETRRIWVATPGGMVTSSGTFTLTP